MNSEMAKNQVDMAAPAGAGAAGKLSLWLVDDNAEFRQICATMLHLDGGFECARQFGSAEAVIEALQAAPGPELMLLDVSLPGMSGASAVKTIKSLSPRTQVFMFSTLFDAQCVAEAKAGGASGYLRKSEPLDRTKKVLRAAVV